jgi:hypothetical protein
MRPHLPILPHRRLVLAGGLLLALPAWAATPAGGRLRFAVSRAGESIGEHEMTFATTGGALIVTIEAAMRFKMGPLGVTYAHQARETWRDGAFQGLETTSLTNGKRERVSARRAGAEVAVETGAGPRRVPPGAAPLSHWNSAVFDGPLFNPQNGRVLKVSVSRSAPLLPGAAPPPTGARWSLRGQAEIDDWYDASGVWSALRSRLPDRSIIEYRRV